MQRVTITIEEELLAEIDEFARTRGYDNRSEVIRDLSRSGLRQAAAERPSGSTGQCVAALVYAYDPEARDLARRLTGEFHAHHDLTLATLHVHLDHDSCLEVAVLRGPLADIRELGEHTIAERGVVHGRVVTIPVELQTEKHAHGGDPARAHAHTRVRGR